MIPSIISLPKPEDGWGVRHIITLMGFLAASIGTCNFSCLSLAITEMVTFHHLEDDKIDTQACSYIQSNATIIQYSGEFDWDEKTQGIILSAYFWGYLIMNIPGGVMAERWGVKWVLGLSLLSSSVATIITPIISRAIGAWGLICLRIIIGFVQGPIHSALILMLANWTSVKERGRTTGIVFSGSYLGYFLAMTIAGFIISNLGWTGVFYVNGAIGIVWFVVWSIIYSNTPLEHPFIKEDEKNHIMTTSGKTSYKKPSRTPWIPILTCVPLWGLIIAQIGHDWVVLTITVDLPKYMKSVLHVSVEQNGVISGSPNLGMWFFSIMAGWVVDLMIFKFRWKTSIVRKICIATSSIGPALGVVAASYSSCDTTSATVFFVLGSSLVGAYTPGSKANILDITSNYAGTVTSLIGVVGGLLGIVTPSIIGILTPNNTLLEWRLVFWISFGIILSTNIAYLIMGSSTSQWWNDPGQKGSYIKRKETKKEETC